jgi:hypothetical protein
MAIGLLGWCLRTNLLARSQEYEPLASKLTPAAAVKNHGG